MAESADHCTVVFPNGWNDATKFEQALRQTVGPHTAICSLIRFEFEDGCSVMVDAALRVLSLCNQLAHVGRRVVLDFKEPEGAMGYLNRIGFFDHLSALCEVLPERPGISGASMYAGHSSRLVEIHKIDPKIEDQRLPRLLTDTLMNNYKGQADRDELDGAAWLVFAELIQNVQGHSETQLDGFAALQVYGKPGKQRAYVAVSDSGLGIMKTLRPALHVQEPKLVGLSDVDLLVEIFRRGVSRHGPERGCGLHGCAQKAIKYAADLDVRLPNQRVLLRPSSNQYVPNLAYTADQLPLLWGTHIGFAFQL